MIQTLKSIIGVYGLDILKDGNKLLAYYSDLAPMQKRERQMLEYLVKCDGHITLMNALYDTTDEQTRKMKQLVDRMVAQVLVSEDIAETVCQNFWEAIGGMPIVLKKPKSTPTSYSGSSSGQSSYTPPQSGNTTYREPNLNGDRYGSTTKSGGSTSAGTGTVTQASWVKPVAIIAAIVVVIGIIASMAGGNSNKGTQGHNSANNQSGQTQKQQQQNQPAQPVETEPKEVALADLYARACDNSVTGNNIREEDVTDSYGNTYKGPYFQLIAGIWKDEAYTELVTGGKYMYLSGTYFSDNPSSYASYSVTFRIYADGDLVLDSGLITRDTKPEDFTVCINNADVVRIVAIPGEGISVADAVWLLLADAKVYN